MEGFSGLIFLGIVYAVLALISKAQKGKRGARPPSTKGKTWYPDVPSDHVRSGTQAEGARLQELLKAMEGVKERAARGPSGRESAYRLPGAEEVEERESLEIQRAPYVRPDRPAPAGNVVDYDDEANALVQRRIREAEERNRPLTKADHLAFDARIRQKAVAAVPGVPDHIQQLRDAVVWTEILGKPVSLRYEA